MTRIPQKPDSFQSYFRTALEKAMERGYCYITFNSYAELLTERMRLQNFIRSLEYYEPEAILTKFAIEKINVRQSKKTLTLSIIAPNLDNTENSWNKGIAEDKVELPRTEEEAKQDAWLHDAIQQQIVKRKDD